jgi:hypothetical protein
MKVMTQDEIKTALEQHKLWLIGEGGCRVNLSGSDLSYSNLSGSNLSYSNLSYSDLSGSKLSGSDLSYSNLSGSNLSGSNLPIAICRMDFGGWSICIQPDKTSIGCQTHASADWLAWTPAYVAKFADGAAEWWAMHGDAVKAAIRCVMAKHEAISKEAE